MRISVYKKIIAAIIFIVIAFAFVNLYSYYGMQNTIKGYEGLVKRSAVLVFDIKELRQEMYKQSFQLLIFARDKQEANLSTYRESLPKIQALSISIDKNLTTPEGKKQFADVKVTLDKFHNVADNYIAQIKSPTGLTPAMRSEMFETITIADKSLTDYADFLAGRMVLRTDQNKVRVDSINQNIVIAIIFIVVISLAAGTFFARSIAKPLQEVSNIAKRIACNDMRDFDASYKGNDEIQDMIKAFKQMIAGLRTAVLENKNASEALARAGTQLNDNAKQGAKMSNQIAESTVNISMRRKDQIRLFTQATESAKEMNIAVSDMSQTVEMVNTISGQSAEAATAGQQAVKDAEVQMEQINSAVEKSTNVISILGESSQKVGDIIGVIRDIASQTNLLALNAAIEAARAGEHGRGFAVVAEEVRKLAEQVAEATQEISAIIIQIQNETQNAVDAMQLGSEEVVKGTEVISNTGKRFTAIAELIERLNKEVSDIKSGTGNLFHVSHVVDDSISEVLELSKKSAQDTKAINAAIEEQSATMQEISASCQTLAGLAEDLEENMKKFHM